MLVPLAARPPVPDMFDGVFAAGRYGAETPGEGFEGEILEGSRIEFDYVPAPSAACLLALATLTALRRRR